MTPGAIEQLAAAGFEDTVFDEAIVTEQHLSHDVINGHATAFIHDGKFILVKTDPERAAGHDDPAEL
jgi:hypothetical protein